MEQRVESAFLYHDGLSYRHVERVARRSYEAMHQWYHRLTHLFDPAFDYHSTAAIDETKLKLEEIEVYVWLVTDVETFGIIHIEVSFGRSDLDGLLFIKKFSDDASMN